MVAADVQEAPRWDTLTVTGPDEMTDGRGRTWFKYGATVQV
jgi:hypothetical protein